MAKPKFYLEPRPTTGTEQAINMFYSFNGKRLQYYTGIRIDIKYFRPECNTSDIIKPVKSTAPYAAQYNKKLHDIAADAVTVVKASKGENLNVKYVREQLDLIHKPKQIKPVVLEAAPDPPHTFISFFDKLINDSATGKRVLSSGKNKGKRFTYNAVKNYRTSLAAIKRFFKYNGLVDIELEKLNEDFYNQFSTYCFNEEKKEISTFAGYIKDIKTVMSEAKVPFNSKAFITPGYEADTIYLNVDQIDKIADLDLTDSNKFVTITKNNVSKKIFFTTLDKVRNLSLIGFYSGLRFSDFSNLDIKSIDNNFIKLKQIKTGSRVVIPIMSKLRPVLAKYPNELPTISNQKFNDYIKEIARLAGLTEIIETKSTKGNTDSIIKQPLYKLVSSHCCRRSYATNMFYAGVPSLLIQSATGHKTESSFLKYIRATNEDKAKLLAETLKKLGL